LFIYITFHSQDARKKAELRIKLQMAQFLQDTLEEMAVSSKQKKKGSSIQRFSEFFQQVLYLNVCMCMGMCYC